MFRVLADTLVVLHFAFIVFAVLGGILSIWSRKIIWVHVPVVVYAALIEFIGGICPLTPLENWLRAQGGGATYPGGFVEHYILPVVYPAGLTRHTQVVLGALVIAVNVLIYWRFYVARTRRALKSRADIDTPHRK